MPGQPRKAAEELLEVAKPLIAEALKYEWESIIDLGCGYGLQAAALATSGRTVDGCDLSPPGLPVSEWPNSLHLWHGTWDALAGGYGGAYAHHILEHTRDPVSAMHLWAAITRPDGKLFLSVPHSLSQTRGGHISAGWNINQLLYVMAAAGWDCRKARAKYVGPSIWAIVDRPEKLELAETGRYGVGWGGADKRLPAEMGIKGNVATVDLKVLNWT